MTDLKWRDWNRWLELNEWNEWIQKKWHESIERVNWNEWIETNELKWMICQPHLEKVVRTVIFLWNQNSRCSPVRILSTSSSKSAKKETLVFYDFSVKSSSRYSLVHILSTLSGSRRATAETETLQRRPRTPTVPAKTQGFAPKCVFSRDCTRSRSLTLPNYLMMMWLTWWCGWHDDWDDDVVAMMVRQLLTIVRSSEVS